MIGCSPASTLGLIVTAIVLLWPCMLGAAPVTVRFAEGVSHGLLLLRTLGDTLIATGDLLQVNRGERSSRAGLSRLDRYR